MRDFLFITENKKRTNLLNSFLYLAKGYALDSELYFTLLNDVMVKGYIVSANSNDIGKIFNKFNTKVIGFEGLNSWRQLEDIATKGSNDVINSVGINLNLAVTLSNVKKKLNYIRNKNQNSKIALNNIETEQGELIAEIFAAIIGDIMLMGSDTERLKTLANKLFNNYGIMATVATHSSVKNNILNIDVDLIKKRVEKMNYSGDYYQVQGMEKYDFIFSAYFVESLLVTAGFVDHSKYNPYVVNVENVKSIAKCAKKAGFLPIFSFSQNQNFEHNNVTIRAE